MKQKPLTPEQAEAFLLAVDNYALEVHVWYDKYYGNVTAQDDPTNPPPIPNPPPPPNNG